MALFNQFDGLFSTIMQLHELLFVYILFGKKNIEFFDRQCAKKMNINLI